MDTKRPITNRIGCFVSTPWKRSWAWIMRNAENTRKREYTRDRERERKKIVQTVQQVITNLTTH